MDEIDSTILLLRRCSPLFCDAQTDKGIEAIAASSPGMTVLVVANTGVTDRGLAAIAKHCTALVSINLYSTRVTDAGLKELASRCPDLSWIRKSGCKFVTEDCAIQNTECGPQPPSCMLEFCCSPWALHRRPASHRA